MALRLLLKKSSTIMRRYPVGIQTFSRIINEDYVYIDKTDLMWKMTRVSPFVFLSRPRRFGKSLLTTTLCSFFEGRRDLFEGLKVMELEKDWVQYPVLHIDVSMATRQHPGAAKGSAHGDGAFGRNLWRQ